MVMVLSGSLYSTNREIVTGKVGRFKANIVQTLPFRSTLIALAICSLLVVICYNFVDRPVARYVHNHQFNEIETLKSLTLPPPIVQTWSPLAMVLLVAMHVFGPWRRWQQVLFLACLSLIVADQFRESLGQLCGRYWPETWHDNNPSYLGTGTYGFDPFRPSDDSGSFPSGHAARIVGFLSLFWIAWPRTRWLCVLIALPMLVALVGMNYHFVGDVVAGAFLGGVVGTYTAACGGLSRK
jgi:membrane-associated phospholipid phosphatase